MPRSATPELHTLSLHDALPISYHARSSMEFTPSGATLLLETDTASSATSARSEEHTSELQSPDHPVCRLLLEKKTKAETKKTELSAEGNDAAVPEPRTANPAPQ